MFTKWQQVENWIRDNGLNSWRFSYDKTGTLTDSDGNTEQKRSNRLAVLSDAFPGDLEEKIALTRRRLLDESGQTLYGYGKRGKENTGQMYCEVRLVDELQQPGTQAVSSPAYQPINEEDLTARIRKQLKQEMELEQLQNERKNFEQQVKEFEQKKNSAIGLLTEYLSPVLAALVGNKQVAGLDAASPVSAEPIQPIKTEEVDMDEIFTEKESDELFDLMARFKRVEPRYLELIKSVVSMAENGDNTYNMAKGFLLK